MDIASHLESALGPIEEGWSLAMQAGSVQVVRFAGQPFEGASTFATLGLSSEVLTMPGNRHVRQELVFAAYDRYDKKRIASFMLTLCEFILSKGQALLRGDVIGPAAPVIEGSAINAVYASIPVIFPDALSAFGGSDPDTVIVWLVPLVGNEASFVRENGWNKFEELLEQHNPDLTDLNRSQLSFTASMTNG